MTHPPPRILPTQRLEIMPPSLGDCDIRPFPFARDGLSVAPLVDLKDVVGRILHFEISSWSEAFGDVPDVGFPVRHADDEQAGEDIIERSGHYIYK